MPRTFIVHDIAKFNHLLNSTPLNTAPVVSRGQAPKGVPLCLPPRFLGRNPSKGGALNALCNDLRVYGCNVSPIKAGTTGGHGQVVSRKPKLWAPKVG